jgi:hypothetical protein
MTKQTEKLDSIFKKHQEHFQTGFHNLLWQVMINECTKGSDVVLYPVHEESGLILAVADRAGGYTPTTCHFTEGIQHKDALRIAETITSDIFNIPAPMQHKWIAESMRGHIKGDN